MIQDQANESTHPQGRPMQIITRQRCLHAANYRYSWRSSVVMLVLSALTYVAVVFEAAKVLDEQEVTNDANR